MKRFSLLLAAAFAATSLFIGAPAVGADLPVKVKPNILTGYPYQGSGFYIGVGAVAAVLNADVGANLGGSNIFSAGAALDMTAGYQFTTGSNWYALEASVQYTNMGGAVACPAGNCAISSTWGFEQRLLAGFPYQLLANAIPNFGTIFPGLPQLPTGTATNVHPYVFVGLREDDRSAAFNLARAQVWTLQPTAGAGFRTQMTNGAVLDTSVGCTFADSGVQLGGPDSASAKFGRDCRGKVAVLF